MTTSNRWALGAAALASALAAASAASDASAQIVHRLYLHGELGLGTMLSSHARNALGYDSLGGELTLRAGLRVVGPINVQLGVANWLWLRDPGSNGRLLSIELGLRGIFRAGTVGSFWLDLNAGPGFSGGLVRAHLNGGLGFDFAVSRTLGVGPFARVGQLVQSADNNLTGGATQDATFFAAGVNLTWHLPEPAAPVVFVDDRDGDGVLDPDDQCVEVPQGPTPDPSRPGCPQGDRDGDGVLDAQDLCPTFPRGDEPNPERLGCPDDDNDGDGVPDHSDRCPLEPMDPRPDPDRLGCRRPETVINLGEILFDTNATTIQDNEQNTRTLSQAQAIFSAHEEINLFSIEGHTDERDSDRHNRELSRGRAEAVRDWLAAHGIAAARMVPAGYGEACPVDPGHTEEAWARNRRVVFVIARRNDAPEAGATFGCAAAAELIPAALGVAPPAESGRHRRHGRHGHRQGHEHRERREGHHRRHGRHRSGGGAP
jgi:outer membrane protein OmpA-like peptidoglycan-associated protein